MNHRTRYRLTLFAAAFLAIVTLLSIAAKMETVATASIAGMMTILSAYIWSQTTRPSQNEYASKAHKKSRNTKNSVSDIFNKRSDAAL
ncbi:MAG: hypothetical protein WD135_03955 [Ferruginibacter sp.]